MGRGDQPLLSPQEISGVFVGNGCPCTPACCELKISPACAGGICVIRSFIGIPFCCEFMAPCGNCYTDCDDEGLWCALRPEQPDIQAKARSSHCSSRVLIPCASRVHSKDAGQRSP